MFLFYRLLGPVVEIGIQKAVRTQIEKRTGLEYYYYKMRLQLTCVLFNFSCFAHIEVNYLHCFANFRKKQGELKYQ